MPVPERLQQLLATALTNLRMHPQRSVLPMTRRQIYEQLDILDASGDRRTRSLLAIITVRHAVPVWYHARPYDRFPDRLLAHAEAVFDGSIDVRLAQRHAERAWKQLDYWGGRPEGFALGNAFYAATAAYQALHEALGHDPFAGILIDDSDTDAALDPWCSDTALWACDAFAGPDRTNIKQSELFWTWWLTEAVPVACKDAHQ